MQAPFDGLLCGTDSNGSSELDYDAYDGIVKLGELFCGAGGMALGASQAKYNGWQFSHAWATDRDPDSCYTIQQVVPARQIKQADIKSLNFRSLEREYSRIDGLVFGFPCNDFSAVGERRGISGKYGGLYKFGVKAIEELNPLFCG